MRNSVLGHQLKTLNDGLTTFANGERVPMPLIATEIDVQVLAGAAIVKTKRVFRNSEQNPIEAIMTFPVGFDSVVTGLSATIDGRLLVGVAQEKATARAIYEDALDEGRMSVLHEEALQGIHVLSVGALPAGAEVAVELEQVAPLADVDGQQFLRIPTTAGQLYGTSPLSPADDLVTSSEVTHTASLRVSVEQGAAHLDGTLLQKGENINILLNRAIELVIEEGSFDLIPGRAADGRGVSVSFEPTHSYDADIDLHVLVDHSGSTASKVGTSGVSVWQAMRNSLQDAMSSLRPSDQISLWQFNDCFEFLGTSHGKGCLELAYKLQGPRGGTELGSAVSGAIAAGAQDLLVMTDGQTWARTVEDLKGKPVRISAILVGQGSLDANIGRLCAMTGGHVFYAPGDDVSSALKSAYRALRTQAGTLDSRVNHEGPEEVTVMRGGVKVRASWSNTAELKKSAPEDAIGRFAAALAYPMLDTVSGNAWARAHCLCTHTTSLVLVDKAGEAAQGLSQTRKVALMSVVSDDSQSLLRAANASRDTSVLNHGPSVSHRMDILVGHREQTTQKSLTKSVRAGKFVNLFSWVKHQTHPPLQTVFEGFAWDRHGDLLLSGVLTPLNHDQKSAVRRIIKNLYKLRGKFTKAPGNNEMTVYALGLIAQKMGGRNSQRFAKKALNEAPSWVFSEIA